MESSSILPDICETRVLDYSIQKVWKAISTAEGIALWFTSNDFQPVEGYEFHMDMEKPQGRTTCKVTLIDPPHRLAYDVGKDWSWTFILKDLDSQTELKFIWSGWDGNKETEFGMSHAKIHGQLFDGLNPFMKRLRRSIRKIESPTTNNLYSGRTSMQKLTFQVIGMACENCVRSVEKALKEIGASGEVSLKSGSVKVEYDENKLSLETVKDAIEDLGYDIA